MKQLGERVRRQFDCPRRGEQKRADPVTIRRVGPLALASAEGRDFCGVGDRRPARPVGFTPRLPASPRSEHAKSARHEPDHDDLSTLKRALPGHYLAVGERDCEQCDAPPVAFQARVE